MSLFESTTLPCPSCGAKVEFQTVHSVNADRRADLRDAIQDGTFQRQACGTCGKTFRLDPEFNYLDVGRHQWIAVQPIDALDRWREREAEVRELYEIAFGKRAPEGARALAQGMKPRLVFGWPALREKLAVDEHGLDDVQLELLKIGLVKNVPDSPLGEDTELRFLEIPDDGTGDLALAWVETATGNFVRGMRVPRELYDDVRAEPEAWSALRTQLEEGPFVDMKRLIAVGA